MPQVILRRGIAESRVVPIKRILLGPTQTETTQGCLANGFRSFIATNCLPGVQPACSRTTVAVYGVDKKLTLKQMFVGLLGEDVPVDTLRLVLEPYTLTFPQIKRMIRRWKKGEDVGLRTNDLNFFPIDGTGSIVLIMYMLFWGGQLCCGTRPLDHPRVWGKDYSLDDL